MKAIFTKFHGPTNTRGARISASDSDGNKVVISYPHELSGEACHRLAADTLCKKMNWTGRLASGGHNKGYVFVFVPALDQAYDALQEASRALTALDPLANSHNAVLLDDALKAAR